MMAAPISEVRPAQTHSHGEHAASLCLGAGTSVRVVTAICMIVFIWAAWTANTFPPAFSEVDVGPGRVPLIASIFGILCGVILFYRAGGAGQYIEISRPLRVGSGMLVIMAYVLLMSHAGFYVSSLVAFPLLMVAGGASRWLTIALSTSGYLLFVYLCFDQLLGVQFP